jgi:RNA-binding protein 26
MKLDNRPKKLLIKDVGSDGAQAVRDWYEAGGQVDAVETLENGDVVVTFRTRVAAELVRFPSVHLSVYKT